jgi:hypothetical protein
MPTNQRENPCVAPIGIGAQITNKQMSLKIEAARVRISKGHNHFDDINLFG